ncbi:MAG: T9SS type A sorting domain-containing protein [Bacteroidetes bacterium]|nr:T9SS type A sorting domain-containing protein [Bacteroidota bacterium]
MKHFSPKNNLVVFLFSMLSILLSVHTSAQSGHIDPSFNLADHGINTTEGADNDVRTLAIQPDGKIILGGLFNSFNGTTANRIERINADGSVDATFNIGGAGADGPVYKVALQPDGKILVAGKFNSFNGSSKAKLVRLNADGSIDGGFSVGSGFNDSVNIVTVQADGKILVGGNFTTYNGSAANYLVRLNADGSKDALFSPVGIGSTVNDIAVQTDNKILAGMQASGFLTRLTTSGATDPTFTIAASGINAVVKAITLQTDGKILVGGLLYAPDFYYGSVVRLNSNGSVDAGFSSPVYEQVNVISLQADGKILVGNGTYYERYTYMAGKKIERLNTNGSVDAGFSYYFDIDNLNQNVYALAVQADGKIVSAESVKWQVSFRSVTAPYYLGTKDFKIKRYNTNGDDDVNFVLNTSATGSSKIINTTAVQADGKIIVGGYFNSFNGVVANHIVRLNTNGTIDPTFITGSGTNAAVNAVAVQPDGKIIIAGYFNVYNGAAHNQMVRLNSNGTVDASFNPTFQNYNWINSIVVRADGKILVGDANTGSMRCLNADGSIDNSFTATFATTIPYDIPQIFSMAVQTDGKIIAGGHFTRISGTGGAPSYSNIARLNSDGKRDQTFNGTFTDEGGSILNIGAFGGDVNAVAIQADGKILAGGDFTNYRTASNTINVNRIMRLTSDGDVDVDFNAGGSGANGTINSITVLSNGKILVAGNFSSYNGISAGGLIRLNSNGTIDNNFNVAGTGANSISINSLTIENGEARLYIAGNFTSYNGTGKNRIARIFIDDSGAPATPTTTTATICASELPYVWNGNNYTATGVYTATVVHPNGTTVDTLILTIGAGNIVGPDRACQFVSANTNATYRITAPAGSAITWSVSSSSTMSIAGGQGTSQVSIHFAGNFSAGAVYAHVVNASCGLNATKSVTVKVTAPSAPGMITASNSSVCSVLGTSNTITYKINKVTAATSYNWVTQAGTTTVTHPNGPGVNDTIINVAFANGFTSSQIAVQAINDCGSSSTRTLNINVVPASAPATISGPVYVCDYVLPSPTGAPAVYTVSAVAGITYNWSIPAGASSVTGQGTNSISFYFPSGFSTGTISVTATNGCGTSTPKTLNVKAAAAQTPGAITTTLVSDCPEKIYTYSIAAIPANATSVLWAVPSGGIISSGQGTTSITVNYGAGAVNGYVSLHSYNTCGASTVRKIAVSLSVCAPPSPYAKTTDSDVKQANNTVDPKDLEVKVYPNPSHSIFNVQVNSTEKGLVHVRVLDITGRCMSETNMNANSRITIGNSLPAGAYLVELSQAKNIITSKIIKL